MAVVRLDLSTARLAPVQAGIVLTTLIVSILVSVAWPSWGQTLQDATCNDQGLQPAQIRCFLDAALTAEEPGICERATDGAVRFNCLSLYAERTLDPAPCERIVTGDQETQALRDACVSGVAIARRDPGLCRQAGLSVIRDSCYMMLVVQFGADPSICEQIEDSVLKSSCGE